MDGLLFLAFSLDMAIRGRLEAYDKAHKQTEPWHRKTYDCDQCPERNHVLLCNCQECEPSMNVFRRRMEAS